MSEYKTNLSYQDAPSPSGGSYTSNKLQKLKFPSMQGKSFLDLGCNAGFYCKHALEMGASKSVGVDLDKNIIIHAKKNNPKVEFFDSGWDVFPDGIFDIIICLSAIHYAKDPVELVNNIRKHLSSNGLFVLEGGIIDVESNNYTDILIPGWRTVGDRCRHLSKGYIKTHLLNNFEWEIIGTSEQRGGDMVARYVIHSTPNNISESSPNYHKLDLLEYAQLLTLSSTTIVASMPSYQYVKKLGSLESIGSSELEKILLNNKNFSIFLDDLVFSVAGEIKVIKMVNNLSENFINRLKSALLDYNITLVC